MIFNLGTSAPRFPLFAYTVGGATYRFVGNPINNANIRAEISGNLVKVWFYTSGILKFDLLLKTADIFVVGEGGNSGEGYGAGASGAWHAAGGGGAGGQVITATGLAIPIGANAAITVGSTNAFVCGAYNYSAAKGQNGSRGYAASSIVLGTGGITSDGRKAADGSCENGGNTWRSGHAAANGVYAFGDSSFDGIRYSACGGSGSASFSAGTAAGVNSDARGAGATSANVMSGQYYSANNGLPGIVLMRIPLL